VTGHAPAPGSPARGAVATSDVMRRADRLLAALAGTLAVATLARLPAAWESGNALNHVSGAWIALADDLVHGTLYRPLHDPALGFGGTRFFPLAFALHAALVRLGAPLLPAGFALSAGAGLLLVAAACALLRRLGVARLAAGAFAALALAGFAGQHALAAVRGDLLAVALEVAGLALVAGAARRRALVLAVLAFALAFAAKPTALTAAAAACAFLFVSGRRRAAALLGLGTAAGAAAVVVVTDAASSGRFLGLLAACAAGGAGTGDLVRSPLRLAFLLLKEDRAGLALATAAVLAGVLAAPALLRSVLAGGGRPPPPARGATGGAPAARATDPRLLPALWLAAALAGALAVFASPGTGVNHLLELEVASAVLLGACAAVPGRAAAAARLAAPAAALAGVVLVAGTWQADRAGSRLAEIRAVLAFAGTPVLSEDPLVPLVAGEAPAIQDPWMLRLVAERDPALARPLLDALRARRPGAVVLFQDLAAPGADAWYARGNLGPGPVAEVRRGYRLARRVGRYFVYVPETPRDGPGGGAPRVADAPVTPAPRPAVARAAQRAEPVPAASTTQPARR
jgi:hypothetical protein